MRILIVVFTTLLASTTVTAAQRYSGFLKVDTLRVHYGIYKPDSEVVGDVLFLHGYGDNFANHQALFKQFNESGLRVIGFDYPSHGKTWGQGSDDLDFHSFHSLTQIAAKVLRENAPNSSRPLFIVGWSTGGLQAIRIAQVSRFRSLFPNLKGLVLYAPGVSVKTCVGNSFCQITNETLNHDTRMLHRQIKPKSPLFRLDFATRLLFNAALSWRQGIPQDLPTIVFVGGSNDNYVNTDDIKSWVQLQRNYFSAPVIAVQCPLAFHELDNELSNYGGQFVREFSNRFVSSIALDRRFLMNELNGVCQKF